MFLTQEEPSSRLANYWQTFCIVSQSSGVAGCRGQQSIIRAISVIYRRLGGGREGESIIGYQIHNLKVVGAEGGAGAGGHPAAARQSLGDPGHGGGCGWVASRVPGAVSGGRRRRQQNPLASAARRGRLSGCKLKHFPGEATGHVCSRHAQFPCRYRPLPAGAARPCADAARSRALPWRGAWHRSLDQARRLHRLRVRRQQGAPARVPLRRG